MINIIGYGFFDSCNLDQKSFLNNFARSGLAPVPHHMGICKVLNGGTTVG